MSSTWNLQRSAGDAKLAGVCGGVAARFDLDPVLVRTGFVLLALTGGIGVVLYLAAWLLLPVAGTGRAAVDDLFGGAAARWPRELWVTLVVVACVVAFPVFGMVSPFGVAPALALVALWWFGLARPRSRRARDARAAQQSSATSAPGAVLPPPVPWSGPPTPFTQAAAAWQARVAEVRTGVWTPPTWPTTPADPPAATPPVPTTPPVDPEASDPAPASTAPLATSVPGADEAARAAFLAQPDPVGLYTEPAAPPAVRPGATLAARRLRLATVAALGLTWLGLGIAGALGVGIGLAVYAGAGLLVVALGLVVATRWGRARGLLPAGVLLAGVAVVTSGLLGPSLSGPAREATRWAGHPVSYTSAAAFPTAGDSLEFGDLDVDLTGVRLTSDATYRAAVETGRVVVQTPPGTGVVLRYAVDTGQVSAYGTDVATGSGRSGEQVVVPPAAGQPTLTLDLRVDTGLIEVRS